MASSFYFSLTFLLVVIFLVSISTAAQKPKAHSLTFPIKKDGTSLQYYTTIEIGTPFTSLDVVIDLGGKFLYFYSDEYKTSSTFRPVRCGSSLCKTAEGDGCIQCFLSPPTPGCTNNTCAVFVPNPFTGTVGYQGLGADVVRVYSTDGSKSLLSYESPNFPFQFSDPALLEGLASGTKGVVGLGRKATSLHSQLASTLKVSQKFALCMPSSSVSFPGNIFIGGGPYFMPPYAHDLSKELVTTPLVRNPVGTDSSSSEGDPKIEYYINVKSIKIDNKVLSLNTTLLSINKKSGFGGTKISTTRPFTDLQTSIHKTLIGEFAKAAAVKGIKRVASVAPFGACFDSKTIAITKTGPSVPVIDLVLHRQDVYWRIYGSNSMVEINEDVLCLGFVDGGSNPRASIVLGGSQLENKLLEFDLTSSKLGFSSSLPLHDTSCSQKRA